MTQLQAPPLSSPSNGAIGRIRLQAHSLSPSLRRVAEHVVQHADSAVHQTITEVATSVGVSEATITRLCRKLDYAGFHAFKIALAADLGGREQRGRTAHEQGGDRPTATERLFGQAARTLDDTARLLDPGTLEDVAQLLARAPRVDLTGQGNSGMIAQFFAHRLMRIGITSSAYTDPHVAAVSISTLPRGGVAIGLSSSGSTIDTVQHLRLAQSCGVYTVAITHRASSPITRHANAVLFTAAQEDPLTDAVLDTLTSQIMLLEVLYAAVLSHRPESNAMLRVTAESVVDKKY
ncbi:MurR/RpiR family transcriptional regulator [Deinococcus humi]|uniref:DNA-binding MurR/RpiR family transcriptional regulator n=1 Tax=Deinococcus humi TaxID=662880 RepID=A0A7W8NHC0_9DEIO|nr:MurR/RpiR family transcriptional regulator [Deinococcus humi]MBB5363842.1 DNA-binding MurR/RpiR family transcriptional regulator [Deinococcus humi]GGO31782.1 RpiR family transcriptional regulator [Deinococcus humi]